VLVHRELEFSRLSVREHRAVSYHCARGSSPVGLGWCLSADHAGVFAVDASWKECAGRRSELPPCLTVTPIHDETCPTLIASVPLAAIWVIHRNGQERVALRAEDLRLTGQAAGEAEFVGEWVEHACVSFVPPASGQALSRNLSMSG